MTVATTSIISGPYLGNGLTDVFAYTFRIENEAQVIVFETDDEGVQTTLTLTADYTVAGLGVDAGGSITRVAGALPTGYQWYIRSNYQETQPTDFESQGAFFPAVHENSFDKLTFLTQQLSDQYNRALHFSDGVSDLDDSAVLLPDDRFQSFIGFNSGGALVLIPFGESPTPGFIIQEQKTLTSGQRTVNFSTVSTLSAGMYIGGKNVDAGRLLEGRDFITVGVDNDEILLTESYPEGSILLGVQNDSAAQPLQNAAQTTYDNSNSEFLGNNLQDTNDEIGVVGPQLVAASSTLYAYNNLG